MARINTCIMLLMCTMKPPHVGRQVLSFAYE